MKVKVIIKTCRECFPVGKLPFKLAQENRKKTRFGRSTKESELNMGESLLKTRRECFPDGKLPFELAQENHKRKHFVRFKKRSELPF
ncbi:hypothetical protein ACT6NV_04440 [Robiginitalea sp. IMCC44478]|uniref:hypothetical protein n=1 Tax=Robiginitalea sp. IMCC44478 TaxID=3459122 RepID=UPI0040434429